MPSKSNSTIEKDPVELTGVTVDKLTENFKAVPANQVPNTTYEKKRREMIATAAYYRAKERGFYGGYEIQDWLEAEAEIDHASDHENSNN